MRSPQSTPLLINGWTVIAHPLFISQVEALEAQVQALRRKDPVNYLRKNATKRLAAITHLAYSAIPTDPGRPEYRQGHTLGGDRKHWFRAKFFQQYRLFFRYHAVTKVIVLVWVNDDKTKRAYESHDDAYRVFSRMLEAGYPPDDWDDLLQQAGASAGAAV